MTINYETEKTNTIRFEDVDYGEVFEKDGLFYLKIFNNSDGVDCAVFLTEDNQQWMTFEFDEDDKVILKTGTLTIE